MVTNKTGGVAVTQTYVFSKNSQHEVILAEFTNGDGILTKYSGSTKVVVGKN
jgi:Na+-translocating ferredoxin:NAD+ oxidoreductase RnfG subunit